MSQTDPVPLPGSLKTNPSIARWLRILPDGAVEIAPGKVEIGQGILTALAQIAAEELDVSLARIRLAAANTSRTPDEGVTAGSLSIQHSGMALRFACAEARAMFLAAAAERLGVRESDLTLEDGTFVGPGNARTSYWELADTVSLARDATASVKPKAVSDRRIAGSNAQRLDIPDKVFGVPCYIHDLALPHMLHGRVIRPSAPQARLQDIEEEPLRAVPGFVRLVRDGSFVGVLAETEEAAMAASSLALRNAVWSEGDALPDCAQLNAWIISAPNETQTVDVRKGAPAGGGRTIRRRYSRPYLAHASIAPSCGLAQWSDGRLKVWSHSQGIFNLRSDLALVFAMPAEEIVVEHVQSAGCYGHNGADDAALDAALLARGAAGRPVRLQWSRENELGRAPFGAAMVVEMEAEIDAAGSIGRWRHEIWSNGHSLRPGRPTGPVLIAATELAEPFERAISTNPPAARGGGAERNSVPLYNLPDWEIVNHRLLDMPIRTSSMRALGGYANVFALESFLDEIAAEIGEDPLALRLRYLADERGRAVLETAARMADWALRSGGEGIGRGIGFARYKNTGAYCAVAADVDCLEEVRVTRLSIAVDVGEAISPDGVINQIEGGAIQATSWTIKEAVTFDRHRITSDNWATYPILRFSEVPAVAVAIIPRPDAPPLGAGEASQGPTAAAIGNAVHHALGVRVRELPINRERILAAMNRQ